MRGERIRVDKWLWYARFFKTRTRAGEVVTAGVRINATRCAKPSQAVKPGDVLTFAQGTRVRVIQIEACGTRRGPAEEAQTLYTDLDPPPPREASEAAISPLPEGRDPGTGRPTKRERREIDAFRRSRS
ncbi:MAG: RNA-binding S4 domain-containing protein [Pseudomonadota bacterium]